MRLETLERLFADVDRYGAWLGGLGIVPKFSFVWHGGEPLLISSEYYRRIAELQTQHIQNFAFRNSVQTNLFGINKGSLKFVLDSGWELGVSIDFANDIRANNGRRDSNTSVLAAAEALHRSGARFGAISVLGAHNRETLPDSYDWVAEFAGGWRILPIFEGGPQDSMAQLRLPEEEVVRVLLAVFERRAASPRHIPIAPLDDYIKAAALKIAGQRAEGDVACDLLDNIFVVNVNGDVFTRPFAYETNFCLGNIARQSMRDMAQSPIYRSCQAAIRQRKLRNCVSCDMRGYCDSSPMHEHGAVASEAEGGRCLVHRQTIEGVETELTAAGIDSAIIAQWAREGLQQQPSLAV